MNCVPFIYELCPLVYELCPLVYELCPLVYELCPLVYELCPLVYHLIFKIQIITHSKTLPILISINITLTPSPICFEPVKK